MPASDETKKLKNKARASLTLLLVAVISITTATYAWFTLSNSATVQSMEVKVGTGTKLMVSTTSGGSTNWDDYKAELDNDDINALLKTATGYPNGLSDIRLWPLTSGNGYRLYTESGNTTGTAVTMATKYYLELDLWFMSSVDMNVYLNGDNSPNAAADDGTRVWSEESDVNKRKVQEAVRVSFTDVTGNSAAIYEPNKTVATTLSGHARTDGGSTQNTFVTLGDNDGTGNGTGVPVVFSLTANTPKNIVIRLWIEGEDPQCVNGNGTAGEANTNLEEALLKLRLRFCGADDSGNYIENTVA